MDTYVQGESDLVAFEDWFLPATWNLSAGNDRATHVANEIRLRLVEHNMGHLSEADLKALLLAAISAPSKA